MVWRCLHLLLLACHRVRGVPAFGAEWEPFPATLRQLLHTAHCIRALQRCVVSSIASLLGLIPWRMCLVLGTQRRLPGLPAALLTPRL